MSATDAPKSMFTPDADYATDRSSKRYPADILATCVVPWREDFSFDEELFCQQVRLIRDGLTRRLYVFGTAGEGYAVSDRQFEEVVRAFHREMSTPYDFPMVGVISLSLSTIIERIAFCRTLGISDFQISLPCWGALTDREVDTFFAETCGRFPDCRFLNYNLTRTKRVLTGSDYARLASAHPNLVAVKYGGEQERLAMLREAPELQYYFTEPGYAATRDRFECGLLISWAIVNFSRARVFFTARGAALKELYHELTQVGAALDRAIGSAERIDGAYDKMLIKSHLPSFPLRLLPPYEATDDAACAAMLDNLPLKWKENSATDEVAFGEHPPQRVN